MTYEQICSEIQSFAQPQRPVKLIAVSKLQDLDKIKMLASKGQRVFAENYVQEALLKLEQLQNLNLEWHFIGHLQKNKVKQIVGKFYCIHSVDSVELAEKISNFAVASGIRQKILLEVNLGGEASKAGFNEADLAPALTKIRFFPGVEVIGLMTMPPLFEDSEKVRPLFKRLRQLAVDNSLTELSMGTSGDYRVALQEGATMVRLGTVLFGERPRKN